MKKGLFIFCCSMFWLCQGICATADNGIKIDLDHLVYIPNGYFNHSSYQVFKEIQVFKDDTHKISIEDIISDDDQFSFRPNSEALTLDSTGVYWTKIELESAEDATDILIEFGNEWLSTWKQVEYYVVRDTVLISSGITGTSLRPSERSLRDAMNLAAITISEGTTFIYTRLAQLHLINDDPRYNSRYGDLRGSIQYALHDPSTYNTMDGYRFPGKFNEPIGLFLASTNYFKQCLEVVVDDHFEIEEVRRLWDEQARYRYWDHPVQGEIYWMRMKVIGTTEGRSSHLFGLDYGTFWNYDRTDVYCYKDEVQLSHQVTGNKVKRSDKTIQSDWNFFRVEALPGDTIEVFLRLEGPGKRFAPVFNMAHIDEDSFWTTNSFVNSIYAVFYGTLIVQFLYFLIVGFIENEKIHFYLVALIAGLGLCLGFAGVDLNYVLFPSIQEWHPWLTAFGSILMIYGILEYVTIYLDLESYFPFNPKYLFYPILFIHSLFSINFGYRLYSIGGDIAIFEGYYQLMFASLIIISMIVLGIGIYIAIKANKHAMFFVLAFGLLLAVFVVRMILATGAVDNEGVPNLDAILIGIYVHYGLLISVVVTMVLLSFGNGYRVRLLKTDKALAVVRIEEEQKRNDLLLEKNKVIEQRVAENDFLITEIHHRVKNNLQILASLLNLQSDYIDDPVALEAIMKGKSRVETIGLLHQMLYISDTDVTTIKMEPYLEELCLYLEDNFSSVSKDIKINRIIDVDRLDIDSAITIGLTVTELITNAMKHAFDGMSKGIIKLNLWFDEDGILCLDVHDNGIGIPENKQENVKESFGTELIDLLCKRLDGEISKETSDGYLVSIRYIDAEQSITI